MCSPDEYGWSVVGVAIPRMEHEYSYPYCKLDKLRRYFIFMYTATTNFSVNVTKLHRGCSAMKWYMYISSCV